MTPPAAQQVERSRKPAVAGRRQGRFLHNIISHLIWIWEPRSKHVGCKVTVSQTCWSELGKRFSCTVNAEELIPFNSACCIARVKAMFEITEQSYFMPLVFIGISFDWCKWTGSDSNFTSKWWNLYHYLYMGYICCCLRWPLDQQLLAVPNWRACLRSCSETLCKRNRSDLTKPEKSREAVL